MSFRTSEEQLPPSEDLSSFCQSGSGLFSLSSEVDNWCQSIPASGGFPLTPPDTASECSLSDCQEMSGQLWTSLPEESWSAITASAPEHSTWLQSSDREWYPQDVPVTAQDLHAMDAQSWLSIPSGPVDMGLSPVLSQMSQSSHTFNSISESELPLLPAGLDLSFVADPSWDASGSVGYSSPDCSVASEFPIVPMESMQPSFYVSSSGHCAQPQPIFHFQGGQAPGPRRAVSDPSIIPRRPLLPRTQGQFPSNVTGHSQGSAPRHQSLVARTESHGSVSNAECLRPETVFLGGSLIQSASCPSSHVIPGTVTLSPCPETVPAAMPSGSTRVYQDLNTSVRCEQKAKLSPTTSSYSNGQPVSTSAQPDSGTGKADQDNLMQSRTSSSANTSAAGEGDEGRHRSHPLYTKGPQPDGLYHCPFKSDPNCQHKPTKLKCNYDKFIDSHLKPFRCKIESCSKQEFSSTACLLRHEREAHGMHGHGDRPHLCYYSGCERGISGNGFPRRYNLFDHMKRVHDHKEVPLQGDDASEPRRAGSRKRKASTPISDEPVARQPKLQHVSQPSPQSNLLGGRSLPLAAAVQDLGSSGPQDEQHMRRELYSRWDHQSELLEFQMNYVGSPNEETNPQRLPRNIEELRRLSGQVRHG